MEWSFVCRTGLPCIARFDGAILEVEVDEEAPFDLDDNEDEDELYGATSSLIDGQGLARTHCASLDVALRELRTLGAEV